MPRSRGRNLQLPDYGPADRGQAGWTTRASTSSTRAAIRPGRSWCGSSPTCRTRPASSGRTPSTPCPAARATRISRRSGSRRRRRPRRGSQRRAAIHPGGAGGDAHRLGRGSARPFGTSRGRATVLSLIHTCCNEPTGRALAYHTQIGPGRRIVADPPLHGRVRVVSPSFDPLDDGPHTMRPCEGSNARKDAPPAAALPDHAVGARPAAGRRAPDATASAEKAALGRRLFFDRRLSSGNTLVVRDVRRARAGLHLARARQSRRTRGTQRAAQRADRPQRRPSATPLPRRPRSFAGGAGLGSAPRPERNAERFAGGCGRARGHAAGLPRRLRARVGRRAQFPLRASTRLSPPSGAR